MVIGQIVVRQTTERAHWLSISHGQNKTQVAVKADRGNIYSSDGRLMASSIPTYYIYMDTRVPALHSNNGALFKEHIDSVTIRLSSYFKDRSAKEYKRLITQAYMRGDGNLQLYPKRISFAQLKDVKNMPLFRLGRYKSGLMEKQQFARVRPFGSLAARTIGDIYADAEMGGKSGLEMYFDEELRGTPGRASRQKVANRFELITDVEPKHGRDIVTTIDINLQDIAENILIKKLRELNAQAGYVVLMEVKSGKIKAMVNMQQTNGGGYTEVRNGIVSDMTEPGSTFKTAALLAAIDDGKVNITDSIDVGTGIWRVAGREMRDHNYRDGAPGTGYGKISVANALHASSNVGISKVIVNAYGKKPEEFVQKLHDMGHADNIPLEIPGTATPNIRFPNDKGRSWSGTTLPWMSIGYEVEVPPLYTINFYNAIANNGKMVQPFLVKEIREENEVVKRFTTQVMKSSIAGSRALSQIKEALEGVVWDPTYGTAKAVQSDKVRIAGKTGTAQISQGKAGYTQGRTTHQVSFCGYFPVENPQYTCICVIRDPRIGYASGGTMSGTVVRQIAERTMAIKAENTPETIRKGEDFIFEHAAIKGGKQHEVVRTCRRLNIPIAEGDGEWVRIQANGEVGYIAKPIEQASHLVPNTIGMGAKDAIYLLENSGLRVHMVGKGRVVSQSIQHGTKAIRGEEVRITLQ